MFGTMAADAGLHPRIATIVPDSLPTRRLALFLAITFGLNWIPAAYFIIEGITLTPDERALPRITLNLIILFASFSPAIGHVLTRWLTDEGFARSDLLLGVNLRDHWRVYGVALLLPFLIAVIGAGLYFAAFPTHLAADPLVAFTSMAAPVVNRLGVPLTAFVIVVLSVLGSVIGALVVIGEEFGWRAYLLPKLVPLGKRRAAVLTGVIWGVWHWPYIGLGMNFGLEYPGAPWLGMLAMVWAPTLYGILLAWATFRSGSVWPAAIGHAAFNTSARWGMGVATSDAITPIGPMSGGLLAATPWLLVAGWLLIWSVPFAVQGNARHRENAPEKAPENTGEQN